MGRSLSPRLSQLASPSCITTTVGQARLCPWSPFELAHHSSPAGRLAGWLAGERASEIERAQVDKSISCPTLRQLLSPSSFRVGASLAKPADFRHERRQLCHPIEISSEPIVVRLLLSTSPTKARPAFKSPIQLQSAPFGCPLACQELTPMSNLVQRSQI